MWGKILGKFIGIVEFWGYQELVLNNREEEEEEEEGLFPCSDFTYNLCFLLFYDLSLQSRNFRLLDE